MTSDRDHKRRQRKTNKQIELVVYKLAYTTCLKTMFNSVYLLQDMNQNLLLISLLLKLTYRIGILEVEAFVLIPNNIRNSTIKERLRE